MNISKQIEIAAIDSLIEIAARDSFDFPITVRLGSVAVAVAVFRSLTRFAISESTDLQIPWSIPNKLQKIAVST